MTTKARARRREGRAAFAGSLLLALILSGFDPGVAQEAPPAEDAASGVTATAVLEKYGWWNKSQQNPAGGTTVPAPPDAPVDGIYLAYDPATSTPPGPVAGAPALVEGAPGIVGGTVGVPAPTAPVPDPVGPQAFGAVRYSIPEGAAGQLVLRLAAAPTSAPLAGATLVTACITTSEWDGVQNGRYDSAPDYDCNVAAPGELSADSLTFDLPATLSTDGMSFDLALVPSGDQPFRLSFQAPTDDSLLLTSVPESSAEFSEDFGTFEDPAAAFLDESTVPETFSTDDFGSMSFDSLGTTSFTPSTRSSVGSPGTARRNPGLQVAVPAGGITSPLDPDASRASRLMAVAILALLAAGLWWVGGMPVRAPRLLGSLGAGEPSAVTTDPADRGIGRFARPRPESKPPRLF